MCNNYIRIERVVAKIAPHNHRNRTDLLSRGAKLLLGGGGEMPREAGGGGASFGTSQEPYVAFPLVELTCEWMMEYLNLKPR